ncbi:MAG: Gfo/Idh/MocA family oxidoreductase [Lentisphaeria bacterium]|nr:Gfo/Idh/MocA family oxidoreductase [Lentisphaeria bacterium]
MEKIFDTDKRVKLGVWGLGRGGNLANYAKIMNVDLVAGCDVHPHMREMFSKSVPGAFVTADEDEFLAQDFDAVLIATYFKDHAKHTIKALNAGKHVMCEVTSFYTPAEGVAVVEAVEKSGKIYNLLENYPFTRQNMYIRKLYQEGFFGEFMYAEGSYLHECRSLCYAYNVSGGLPVEPGWQVHSWRACLNTLYYNTHSLGPLMHITGLRPVQVSAIPCEVSLPGYLGKKNGRIMPSMVKMSNGGLLRNLMGAGTSDRHRELCLWGTRACVENSDREMQLRLGACGAGMRLRMNPKWEAMASVADLTGHCGGDFWELYYFIRQILTGEKSFWDIYNAADVTLAGIMAARSCDRGGDLVDVPDFRRKEVRDQFRNDNWSYREEFDSKQIFPEGHDPAVTGKFTTLMTKLYPLYSRKGIPALHMAFDGMRVYDEIADWEGKLLVVAKVGQVVRELPEIAEACKEAQKIADAYPDSLPGKMLYGVLSTLDLRKIYDVEGTREELRRWLESRPPRL